MRTAVGIVCILFGVRMAILARLGKKRYDEAFLKTAADHLVHVMLKPLENGGGEK